MGTIGAKSLRILKCCQQHHKDKLFTYGALAVSMGWKIEVTKKWLYPLVELGLVQQLGWCGGSRGRQLALTDIGKNTLTAQLVVEHAMGLASRSKLISIMEKCKKEYGEEAIVAAYDAVIREAK